MALVAPGSFHEWLMQSSYVWGRDQTAAVVGRKKCRSHRKGATGGEGLRGTTDRAPGDGLGKVSNRRYRRWLNDKLLRDLAPPMEAAEIESLFAPPPWGEQRIVTPLERVTGGGTNGAIDMAGWEPFRNVDMDTQTKWIQHAEQSRSVKGTCGTGKQSLAMEAWRGVEHTAREALRRNSQSPVLQEFEEKILVYLSEVEGREGDKDLALEAATSYHRLLLHGLIQFHGLVSRTVAVIPNDRFVEGKIYLPGQSLIIVKRKNSAQVKVPSACGTEKPLSLVEFLREVQHQSQVEMVA